MPVDFAIPDCGCLCENAAADEHRTPSASKGSEHIAEINGRPVSLEKAIDAARELLISNHCPLITGLRTSAVPTVRAAVHLAETLGCVIDPASTPFTRAWRAATTVLGCPTLTLGELRDRADLVVFWGQGIQQSHPEFVTRFVNPPLWNSDRQRRVLTISADQTWEAARWLRRGMQSSAELGDPPRPHTKSLLQLLQALRESQHAVVCVEELPEDNGEASLQIACEELIRLARENNAGRRLSLLPLIGQRTAETVLTWQTGYPGAVSFRNGTPDFDERRWNAERLLTSGEADCVVLIGDANWLSDESRSRLHKIPIIQISASAHQGGESQMIHIGCPSGAQEHGTRYRLDGVPVHSSGIANRMMQDRNSVASVIGRLIQEIGSTPGRTSSVPA